MSSSEGKKERRRKRHLRNIQKEIEYKKDAWDRGKLIEENHNNSFYSEKYTQDLCSRLVNILINICKECNDVDMVVSKFRLYKNKIRDLILHWNPNVNKGGEYNFLKESLEVYWDDKEHLINYLSKNGWSV